MNKEQRTRLSLSAATRIFLAHPSPRLLAVICGGFAALRLGLTVPLGPRDLALLAGVMLWWPFQEWWMHRWLLHLPPLRIFGRHFEAGFARTHRLHHNQPDELRWVFLPLRDILGALVCFSGIGYALGGVSGMASFMTGASASTLLYEWTHFLTHTSYRPRGRWYRLIWQQHRWHHYKNERYWFSFTVPWIDPALGTGPAPSAISSSPTARTLGRTPEGQPPTDEN